MRGRHYPIRRLALARQALAFGLAFAFTLALGLPREGGCATHSIDDIGDLQPYVTDGSLVIYDLDRVLLNAPSVDEWARIRRRIFDQLKIAPDFEAVRDWDRAADLTDLDPVGGQATPVEEGTAGAVAAAQGRTSVMGLTARGIHLNRWTQRQLEAIGIDLGRNFPVDAPEEHYFGRNLLFQRGIVYVHTESRDKGETLVQFLDHIGIAPPHVLFVDDKSKNVQEVHEALRKRGVRVDAFWYKRAHERAPIR